MTTMDDDKDLRGDYHYEYPRPALTTDCVIFGFDGREMRVLLIERGLEPYRGHWALPGGFMRPGETVEQCARRELREETGLGDIWLRQVGVYSRPGRDPRGWVVSVAFLALVPSHEVRPQAGDDAATTAWFDADQLPPLAFDHADIVAEAARQLRRELRVGTAMFHMLGDTFTMTQLRHLAEWGAAQRMDRRNFERRMLSTGLVAEAGHDDADDADCADASMEECDALAPMAYQCKSAQRRGKRFFRFAKRQSVSPDDGDLDDTIF